MEHKRKHLEDCSGLSMLGTKPCKLQKASKSIFVPKTSEVRQYNSFVWGTDQNCYSQNQSESVIHTLDGHGSNSKYILLISKWKKRKMSTANAKVKLLLSQLISQHDKNKTLWHYHRVNEITWQSGQCDCVFCSSREWREPIFLSTIRR